MKKIVKVILFVIMSFLCFNACTATEPNASGKPNGDSKYAVKLLFNNEELIVDMYNNNSAKDFVSLLPLTLNFDDYNSAEKTSTLPSGRKLNTSDAPSGYDPSAGEMGYYSPWGNMVIYHRDFSYASGIVPLGKFRAGVEKFTALKGTVLIRFEVVSGLSNDDSSDFPQNPIIPPQPSEPESPSEPTPPIVTETPTEITKMLVKINKTIFNAELYDNATAKAFAKILPLTISMNELNGNEKYNYLSSNLPTNPSSQGMLIEGDLMLFGSNCFVLFYETFSSSYSYSKIGKILDTAELASAVGRGSITISFSADK